VICNNAQYKILKDRAKVLKLPAAMAGRFEGLDVDRPSIDYVSLSESLGVRACRANDPDQLSELVAQSLSGDVPQLIEVAVQEPPADAAGRGRCVRRNR
jgi:thiamine pyrophosphate-dependent acetolactate synthase large subunit-like protein